MSRSLTSIIYEPRCEKNGLRGFRPGPTQIRLYSQGIWQKACNFGFMKYRDCTIHVAKTKALISFAVTAKLICVFVFASAKIRFSHKAAHIKWDTFKATINNSSARARKLINVRVRIYIYHCFS